MRNGHLKSASRYDYYDYRYQAEPEDDLISQVVDIIVWNLWQMDGLKDTIPLTDIPATIMDWKNGEAIVFKDLKEKDNSMK